MSILSFGDLWVLAMAQLLSGMPPGDWEQSLPIADAMVTHLMDLAGIPRAPRPSIDELTARARMICGEAEEALQQVRATVPKPASPAPRGPKLGRRS